MLESGAARASVMGCPPWQSVAAKPLSEMSFLCEHGGNHPCTPSCPALPRDAVCRAKPGAGTGDLIQPQLGPACSILWPNNLSQVPCLTVPWGLYPLPPHQHSQRCQWQRGCQNCAGGRMGSSGGALRPLARAGERRGLAVSPGVATTGLLGHTYTWLTTCRCLLPGGS